MITEKKHGNYGKYVGEKSSRYKHGYKGTKIYWVWQNLKKRCLNNKCNNYKYYGGRGIGISEEFLDVKTFCEWALQNGYKEGLQIDRINVNGNYESSNCRFVTSKVNCNNRRDRKKKSNFPVGVYPHGKKFQAQIGMSGKLVYLGTWDTQEQANRQYQCIKRIYVASLESK